MIRTNIWIYQYKKKQYERISEHIRIKILKLYEYDTNENLYQKIFEYIQISNYLPHPGAHLSDASPNERLVNTANLSRLPPLLIIHPLSTLETVGKDDEKKNCGQCFGVNVRVNGASNKARCQTADTISSNNCPAKRQKIHHMSTQFNL